MAVIGSGLWARRFGGDPNVLGRTLALDGAPHEVIGVMPAGVTFPDGVELWLPLTMTPDELTPNQRGAHYLRGVARLRDGVTLDAARAELIEIERRIATQYSAAAGYGAWAVPMLDAAVGSVRQPLVLLLGAVGFLLLIACANVSTLLLASATTRRGEIAVRCALGAARTRIVQQLLVESVVLGLAAGVLGVLIAGWGVRGVGTLVPQNLPRADAIGLNTAVLLFTFAVSMLTGVVFGIAPALYASTTANLPAFLKDERRDGGAGGGRRALGALVAAEIAMAVVLLVGAGLAIHSFARITAIDPGFDARQTIALGLTLPDSRDAVATAQFYGRYVEAVASNPEINAAGAVSLPPLAGGGFGGTFSILDRDATETLAMSVRAATPGYFETLRIPIVRGRGFIWSDHATAERIGVLSAEAARRFWPDQDPIGQRIRLHVGVGPQETERRIVGIAGDVRTGSLTVSAGPLVYVPHAQFPTSGLTTFARAAGGPDRAAAILRDTLRGLDADLAPTRIRAGEALVAASVAQPRFRTILLGLFAAVALTLAAVGLYGVTAFSVSQRRTELGLRMALGADSASVVRLVLRQGAAPVAAGLVIGIAGAAALAQMFSSLFFGLPRIDPLTFAAVPVVLTSVAALAAYLPARRASKLDPLAALRE